jgi:cell division protein ZapA
LAQVSVTINGRIYQISCDDGQEANLMRLAGYVDKRVGELVASVGQVGDDRLLVMANLLVADELSDAATRLDGLDGSNRLREEESLISNIDTLAERIEHIAQRLEQS